MNKYKGMLEEVEKLDITYPYKLFCGYHKDKNDRQVLSFDISNDVCRAIGKDDYVDNLYIENKQNNLIEIWSYKKGWNKKIKTILKEIKDE